MKSDKALVAVLGFGIVSLICFALGSLIGLDLLSYCMGYLVCASITPFYFAFVFRNAFVPDRNDKDLRFTVNQLIHDVKVRK